MSVDTSGAIEKMDTVDEIVIGEISLNPHPDPNLSNESPVYRGNLANSIKNVVVKKIEIAELDEFKKRMNREFMASKESERIQNVLNIEKIELIKEGDRTFCYIAYENFDSTLLNLVNSSDKFEMKQILLAATEGLMHFHDKGFVHRNIQPENIVILRENNQMIGKISDLSMSKVLSDGKNATISRDFSENGCSAPELINFYKHDKCSQKKSRGNSQKKKVKMEVDVFSMGIVYFYALTGHHLFETDGQSLQQNICRRNFEPNYNTLEHSKYLKPWEVPLATQLIKSMVKYEPNKRPTVKHILNHPFFWTDPQKQDFLFVTSQYIQGCDVEKDILNTQCGPNYCDWKNQLSQDILKQIQNRKYGSNVSELLRLLRNLPAHVNEFKNKELRDFFNNFSGGVVEYFSTLFPNYFHDFYNYFNEFASYDTLRKYYCDCFLECRFDIHKCRNKEHFCVYIWEKFEFIQNS